MRHRSKVTASACAVMALALLTGCVTTPVAQQRPLVSDVAVDVRPLRMLGLDGYADRVADAVLRGAHQQFQIAPGSQAPALILRVRTIQMTSISTSDMAAGKFGGSRQTESDYISGSALLVRGTSVVAQTDIVTSLPATGVDLPPVTEGEQRRLNALGQAFAQWARRRLPL